MVDPNPYQSPSAASPPPPTALGTEEDKPGGLHAAWAAIFAINLTVPLIFGWSLVSEHGKLGMSAAAIALLIGGWCVCSVHPLIARQAIVGGTIVGLSQLIPVVQMVAGLLGRSRRRCGRSRGHGYGPRSHCE